MAILVTGGAGFIGSHTIVELLNLTFYKSDEELIEMIFGGD